MTNKEIIADAAVRAEIYTEEEVIKMIKDGVDIPLHTVSGWMKLGNYKVKEGEEGIEVRLWKKGEKEDTFYKTKAKLFRLEQMELVNE